LNNIIDVNKVFLTGYSAGGDGVYHMAPRMADFLAGAAMMAGHPNGINMMNIRNIGFSLQVGGNDTAYNRNKEGIKNIRMLNQMNQNYGGFKHQSKIHDGKPHWMAL
jgi:poly(3-hydroxybutyrate) depolymerase